MRAESPRPNRETAKLSQQSKRWVDYRASGWFRFPIHHHFPIMFSVAPRAGPGAAARATCSARPARSKPFWNVPRRRPGDHTVFPGGVLPRHASSGRESKVAARSRKRRRNLAGCRRNPPAQDPSAVPAGRQGRARRKKLERRCPGEDQRPARAAQFNPSIFARRPASLRGRSVDAVQRQDRFSVDGPSIREKSRS